MVPPVPTPETRTSILPSVSSQISGPVVLQVDLGIGRIVELLQQHVAVGIGLHDLLGFRDRAGHALRAFGQHQFRAEAASTLRRSSDMVSGMVSVTG